MTSANAMEAGADITESQAGHPTPNAPRMILREIDATKSQLDIRATTVRARKATFPYRTPCCIGLVPAIALQHKPPVAISTLDEIFFADFVEHHWVPQRAAAAIALDLM